MTLREFDGVRLHITTLKNELTDSRHKAKQHFIFSKIDVRYDTVAKGDL